MIKNPKVNARSRVTSKFQATIPLAIREVLALEQGDTVVFEVVKGQVIVRRELPLDKDYLDAVSATLSEWNSAEDDKAYGDL